MNHCSGSKDAFVAISNYFIYLFNYSETSNESRNSQSKSIEYKKKLNKNSSQSHKQFTLRAFNLLYKLII